VSDDRLIVGFDNSDDGGVVRVDSERALIQTVDFFTPIVDDPYQFGRIAAANSLSDVYAMGGEALSALNIVCFPSKQLPVEVLGEILKGGSDTLRSAGAVLAGGHTVRDKELKYGMAVTGVVHPERVWTNGGACVGDVLVLTKPVGTGILTTALKRDVIQASDLEPAVESMARLNRDAMLAALDADVHACTDITGNGLAGHLWEMARGAQKTIRLRFDALPLLPGTLQASRQGCVPGGAKANGRYVGAALVVEALEDSEVAVVLDPQTSGGLLFAVPESDVDGLLARLKARNVQGVVVGDVVAGEAQLCVSR